MKSAKKAFNNHIKITEALVAAHGLKAEEYDHILQLIGREPSLTELGIFSAMWNEHCSYKSSKKWLKTLPTSGPCVIQGPGENAGVVDIGDGDCVVFKIESHNHPSFLEPYQGAATGVGGILRDVFTMGARPIAAMNALRFGAVDNKKTRSLVRRLVRGVVSGIGGYANAFGVPTVGGEVEFDASYNGNILVNAFAAGLAKKDKIFYSKAQGVGLALGYLGAKTGRDGIGGATMASSDFTEEENSEKPTVQVGDPFTEKCLLEACLELMEAGAVIAIQDMGAAGLTCSAVEMGAKGDLGVELNLDHVPLQEPDMNAYEMMLSESQERMLVLLRPGFEEKAAEIFKKWHLDFALIGKTTDDLRFRVYHKGEEVVNLPIKELGDAAPEYDRPWVAPEKHPALPASKIKEADNLAEVLLTLLGSPNQCSRRWVYEQYDGFIQGNSLLRPGADAGVVRICDAPAKALAFSCDVTPRYCAADPYLGGMQAVAECWRNLTATGALPLAASDNLNFGNPERPEIMGQIIHAIKGIGEACKALDFPIVSGNVSLYNETDGQAILPTPTIAGVGLLKDYTKIARLDTLQEGDAIFLVGRIGAHLGRSIYQEEILARLEGAPPQIDLLEEKKNGDFVRSLISQGYVKTCHDISSGGLGLALAEMAIKSRCGMHITLDESAAKHAQLFGEDQARYVIAVSSCQDSILRDAENLGIELHALGVAGGDALAVTDLFTIPLAKLTTCYEAWFPKFMEGKK